MGRWPFALAVVAACSPFATNTSTAPDAATDAPPVPTTVDAGAPDDAGADSPDAAEAGTQEAGSTVDHAIDLIDDSYVEVDGLTLAQDYTLEAWIFPKTNTLSNEQTILAKDRSGDATAQCRLMLKEDDRIYFTAADKNGNDDNLSEPTSVRKLISPPQALGRWMHVAVTKTGKKLSLYIDGKLESDVTLEDDFVIPPRPDIRFRIGARYNPGVGSEVVDTFFGVIDDVRVWNVGLTPAQIEESMKKRALSASTSGLVVSYGFDEAQGNTVSSTTAQFPGVLKGGGAWVVANKPGGEPGLP